MTKYSQLISVTELKSLLNRPANNVVILEAGDKIKMQCATGNVIKMTASVLQISRPTEVTTT